MRTKILLLLVVFVALGLVVSVVKAADQDRIKLRLRDGSCQLDDQDRIKLRLRDGSCQLADQDRIKLRLRDGSCRLAKQNGKQNGDCLRDGSCQECPCQ